MEVKKKGLTALSIVLALTLAVAGCARATPTPTPKASWFDVDSPEDLRAYFARAKAELKLVIDEDIAVKFIPKQTNIDTCAAATIYHITSMSSAYVGYDGVVGGCCFGSWLEGKYYKSEEGADRLEAVITDERLMQRVRARIEEIQGGLLPEREKGDCRINWPVVITE